jgi:Zn-dependent protease
VAHPAAVRGERAALAAQGLTLVSESPLQRLRRLEAEERAGRTAVARREPVSPSPAAGGAAQANRRGFTATIVGAILFALAKGKVLLGALKFGSLLQTFSTLLLSAAVYSRYYGWNLAVGLVLLILMHEYGHGIAAKIVGLEVGAPIFIPFFGAVIALKEQPRNAWIDAVVGFGGPFAGMAGGACALAAGIVMGPGRWGELLVVLAWMTFTLNLFNLMPLFGLDGDRVSQPFRPWFWIPGGFVVLALAIASAEAAGHLHPFLLLMLILGAVKGTRLASKQRRERIAPPQPSLLEQVTKRERYADEPAVLPWQRTAAAFAYFGLVAALSILMIWSHSLLKPIDP